MNEQTIVAGTSRREMLKRSGMGVVAGAAVGALATASA